MNHCQPIGYRVLLLIAAIVALSVASSQIRADTGMCNGASITLPFLHSFIVCVRGRALQFRFVTAVNAFFVIRSLSVRAIQLEFADRSR